MSANSVLAFFLILGFPLAIFFAWAFEMTPEGIKLEKNVDRDESITPITGRKLDRTIIALLVVTLGYFVWQSQKGPGEEAVETVAGQESIAVLPFDNMSSDEGLLMLTSVLDGGWDYQFVQVYSVRGEIDEAFTAMDAVYANRDTRLQMILGDRYLETLRVDPRHEAMVEKMALRVDP